MENTIYFKDISNCDKNNYPNKIYRVEHSKMLIEILDDQHIQGSLNILVAFVQEIISSIALKIIF